MKRLAAFLRRDDGAVTVDWVVLTALVVALTVLTIDLMTEGTTGLTDGTAAHMSGMLN